MNNILEFPSKKPARAKRPRASGTIWITLNKAMMTIQHLSLVVDDQEQARELLLYLADCDLSKRWLTFPDKFHEAIENMNVEATYRAILGVTDEDE